MEEVWIAFKDGRVIEQVLRAPATALRWSVDVEGAIIHEVPRLGDLAAELYDPETREWIPNPDHAGFLADFDAGPEHIAFAHLTKAIEARLILSGQNIDGMLKAEADALGMPVDELARAVDENARAAIVKEVERRLIKKERVNGN